MPKWRKAISRTALAATGITIIIDVVVLTAAWQSQRIENPVLRFIAFVIVCVIILCGPVVSVLAVLFGAPILRHNSSQQTASVFD